MPGPRDNEPESPPDWGRVLQEEEARWKRQQEQDYRTYGETGAQFDPHEAIRKYEERKRWEKDWRR